MNRLVFGMLFYIVDPELGLWSARPEMWVPARSNTTAVSATFGCLHGSELRLLLHAQKSELH